jgi:hypothetical protein
MVFIGIGMGHSHKFGQNNGISKKGKKKLYAKWMFGEN